MNVQLDMDRKIATVEKPSNNLYICPIENYEASARTRRCIKRHLKNCKKMSQNKKRDANNKVCKYCHKTFLKKSNTDRQDKQFHENSNNTTCEDIISRHYVKT